MASFRAYTSKTTSFYEKKLILDHLLEKYTYSQRASRPDEQQISTDASLVLTSYTIDLNLVKMIATINGDIKINGKGHPTEVRIPDMFGSIMSATPMVNPHHFKVKAAADAFIAE